MAELRDLTGRKPQRGWHHATHRTVERLTHTWTHDDGWEIWQGRPVRTFFYRRVAPDGTTKDFPTLKAAKDLINNGPRCALCDEAVITNPERLVISYATPLAKEDWFCNLRCLSFWVATLTLDQNG